MDLLNKIIKDIKPLDQGAIAGAKERQNSLTKPIGSLGRLEELSIQIAGAQGAPTPRLDRKFIFTFAADHHVVFDEGIASAPMEVTAQQIDNFCHGGGAVSVLARHCGAQHIIVDMGVATPYKSKNLINKFIAPGAANIALGPAMSREQAIASIEGGIEAVLESTDGVIHIAGIGEMGIGNTTPSSAIYSLYTGLKPEDVCGPGASLDKSVASKKSQIVTRALRVNRPDKKDPIDVLSKVGGFEIGAMAGAMLATASLSGVVVVDGFISTAAAILARELAPGLDEYLIFSHNSAETGHGLVCNYLGHSPLFDLGLRLGEGTGAALAISLAEAAVKSLCEMATFSSAGVIDIKKL